MVTAGSRGDGMRRANLALVLRTVHREGPRSRAALTEATGLNRSTIADLVGELQRAGLVVERASDAQGRVGRPSPIVEPDPRVVAVAVNPEVDALDIAAVALDGSIVARERLEQSALLTPERTAELVGIRLDVWRRGPLADSRLTGVGVAVPGPVRASDGLVREAPHLGWTDAALAGLMTDATGLTTHVANDAALGAVAEHLFGAARGVHDVVYLNGGASGIGGAVIVGGIPLGGAAATPGSSVRTDPASPTPTIGAHPRACSKTRSADRFCCARSASTPPTTRPSRRRSPAAPTRRCGRRPIGNAAFSPRPSPTPRT